MSYQVGSHFISRISSREDKPCIRSRLGWQHTKYFWVYHSIYKSTKLAKWGGGGILKCVVCRTLLCRSNFYEFTALLLKSYILWYEKCGCVKFHTLINNKVSYLPSLVVCTTDGKSSYFCHSPLTSKTSKLFLCT